MDFRFALASKWRIIYTHDDDPEQVLYYRVFNKSSTMHTWMDQNPDKTIQRMHIQYTYSK